MIKNLLQFLRFMNEISTMLISGTIQVSMFEDLP